MGTPNLNQERPVYLRVLTFLIIALLITGWVLPAVQYNDLPGEVPSHFNARGEVDRYRHKAVLFLMPAIGSFTAAVLLLVGGEQHRMLTPRPYHVQLNPIAEKRMLHILAVLSCVLFIVIGQISIIAARTGVAPNTMPLVFVLVAVMVVYPFVEMIISKKKKPA